MSENDNKNDGRKIIAFGFFDPCSSLSFEKVPPPTYMNTDLIKVRAHGIPVLNGTDTVEMKIERKELISALKQLKKEAKKKCL